jgi:hypothetical protein
MKYTIKKQYGIFTRGDMDNSEPTKEELLWQSQEAERYKKLGIYGQEYEVTMELIHNPELDDPVVTLYEDKDTQTVKFILIDL